MKWTSTFSYLPIPAFEEKIEVEKMSQIVIFDNNLNGERVRIHFSNRYGSQPLVLQKVAVGIVAHGWIEGRKEITGKMDFQGKKEVTFQGKKVICLEAGEEYDSDEIELTVSPGCKIGVFIYIEERQRIESFCSFWSRKGAKALWVAEGDMEERNGSAAFGEELLEKITKMPNEGQAIEEEMRFFGFSGMQVWTEDKVKTIAAFGDSITHMSCVTNALGRRLMDEYSGKVALLNRGIGGNRLLYDAAYVESIAGNEDYPKEWMEEFEAIRCEANEAIRNGRVGYDGFFDYDAAVRDGKNPAFMKAKYHIGDGLHPNDAGGEAMVSMVDWAELLPNFLIELQKGL